MPWECWHGMEEGDDDIMDMIDIVDAGNKFVDESNGCKDHYGKITKKDDNKNLDQAILAWPLLTLFRKQFCLLSTKKVLMMLKA